MSSSSLYNKKNIFLENDDFNSKREIYLSSNKKNIIPIKIKRLHVSSHSQTIDTKNQEVHFNITRKIKLELINYLI